MAVLPVGGLKSTTLEDTFLEVAQLLKIAEQAVVPAVSKVTLTVNSNSNIASISANLPVVSTISATGAVIIAATEYA